MRVAGMLMVLVLLSLPAYGWEEPPGFHGTPWGASQASVADSWRDVRCYDSLGCMAPLSVGGVETKVYLFFGDQGLDDVSLTFPPLHFDTMVGAFLGLYGPPTTREQQTVQSRMGASFLNDTLTWHGDTVDMTLQKYGSKVTESKAIIRTKAGTARLLAQHREAIDDAKASLR